MLKIKIRRLKTVKLPQIIKKGDWIDLYTPHYESIHFDKGDLKLVPLGIAMKLPPGYEAYILSRSSTAIKHKLLMANAKAVIDNSYSGNNDEWKFAGYAIDETTIHPDDRICQFRIQLSQKATFWQKLKWLFTSKIELEEVEYLDSVDRGGFGSTGK